jgi:predicted TIM-barrel fold metal-dependent hydrolase
VIVDSHTHVFPAEFLADREAILRAEPLFAELYAAPQARMATAADLLTAMDQAGVDHAVVCGFAWQDTARCRRHNDALLHAAARSQGRLSAFCCVPFASDETVRIEVERCAAAGARGLGELRPEALGVDLACDTRARVLADAAVRLGLPILLHASEPVGHDYPGKAGQSLGPIWRWLSAHPKLVTVLAHLGGGLPFFAHMPEVGALFTRTFVDTAAVPWLYARSVYRPLVDLIGADRILFASDFPLRDPVADLAVLRGAGLSEAELGAILGDNAMTMLNVAGPRS